MDASGGNFHSKETNLMTTDEIDPASEFSGDALAEKWLSLVDEEQPFTPMAYYDADGDCVEILASNESYRAERVHKRLTQYRGRETGNIIGAMIFGVRRG